MDDNSNTTPVAEAEDYAVEVVSLGFGYPGAQRYSLQDVKLSLPKGIYMYMHDSKLVSFS